MAHRLTARTFLALSLMASGASADDIVLQPNSSSVQPGDVVEVTAIMDFQTETVGGGVGVAYDPTVLTFESFTFDPSFTANFVVQGPSSGSTQNPLETTFGWFLTRSPLGPTPIGLYRFTATTAASPTEIISEGLPGIPFSGLSGDLTVVFSSTSVTVPEPGFASALVTGLVGLGFLYRRKRPSRGC